MTDTDPSVDRGPWTPKVDRRTAQRPSPDVQAVCRWLPTNHPSGAFSGRHDRVHIDSRHGLVNLWDHGDVVHPGTYVGPPRGGLHPRPTPDYSVAMPAGGFLEVVNGTVMAWGNHPRSDQVVRADGEVFESTDYSGTHPYFLDQYRSMTPDQARRAIVGVQRRSLSSGPKRVEQPANRSSDPRSDSDAEVSALLDTISNARVPVTCDCASPRSPKAKPIWPYRSGTSVPPALLSHTSAMATMAGMGNPDDAIDVVWRLSDEVADPVRTGLAKAAESAAKSLDRPTPDAEETLLTEGAVALVAAQAIRWHGGRIVPKLPFWTLGWIFLSKPLLADLQSQYSGSNTLQQALDRADRLRVDRANQIWSATRDATEALARLSELATSGDLPAPDDANNVIDLRADRAPEDNQRPLFPRQDPARSPAVYNQTIAKVLSGMDDR